ncbi:MAG: helix-turn-helix domain-containing protein [Actinomycetota bacterium]|nr:helix-turn-helix domain-containing protein [Actinomycetota bacterium]
MTDVGSVGAPGAQEWYSLREVASALGVTRQAVHARVKSGRLESEQIDGVWRIPASAVTEAVQAQRRRFVGSGSVRILPVHSLAGDEDLGISDRVVALEAAIAELSGGHRRQLAERDREVAVLEERCQRLTKALHQMVDLLGTEALPGAGSPGAS